MSEPRLTDVFVECLVANDCGAGARRAAGEQSLCFELHRVQWLETLEPTALPMGASIDGSVDGSVDGPVDSQRVLCHFRAPDAESVRQVLRRIDVPIGALWVARNNRIRGRHS